MIRVNITINRAPKDVWAYMTNPATWVEWWGGALSGVQPGWQSGGSLVWASGDTSPIDSVIPNKLLRIKAGYMSITFMLMPGSGASTTVEIEEGDTGQAYDDGGAAQQAQYQQILQGLKAGVESTAPAQAAAPAAAPPSVPPAPAAPGAFPSAPPAPASVPPGAAPLTGGAPAPSAPPLDLSAGIPPLGDAPMGDAPLPTTPSVDDELIVKNTGSKVAAIIVVLLIIAGVVGVLVYLQRKQAEVEKHEAVKAAFQTAHLKGYAEFWKKVQVDVKEMKSNQEFEARMRVVTANPTRYAKHIKENAIPIIDNSMADYKAMFAKAPKEYHDKIKAIVAAMESLRNEWNDFASEYLKFEDFAKANKKLETASSHWLGWQQKPGTEKWKYNAVKYAKLLRCIFGKKMSWKDFESTETEEVKMEVMVMNSCAKAAEKPEWFRRVAFECIPKLLGKPIEPDADFEAAVAAFQEINDTTSKLGIDTCIKRSRPYFESEAISKLAKPWADYVKAQNALLDAIDANLEKFK